MSARRAVLRRLAALVAPIAISSQCSLAAVGDDREISEAPAPVADRSLSLRRVALVVGVDRGRTRFATNGASALAQKLRAMRYDVLEASDNPDRARLLALIEQFGEKAKGADVSLFYFAGHGLQLENNNYLVPAGAEPTEIEQIEGTTVPIAKLFDELRKAGDGAHVVILDACRDNPFLGASLTVGLAEPANAPTGRTFIGFAAAPGAASADADSNQPVSYYTAAILRYIATPGGRVEEVFKRVRQDVAEQTRRQVPWDNTALLSDVTLHDAVRIRAEILDGDDEVVLVVGGETLAYSNPALRSADISLPAGDTPLRVWVYNQHTFVGHNSLFGAPEGWRYQIRLSRPDGTLVGRLGSGEKKPEKDGPRHGKSFEAARATLQVDGLDRTVGLVDADASAWRRH